MMLPTPPWRASNSYAVWQSSNGPYANGARVNTIHWSVSKSIVMALLPPCSRCRRATLGGAVEFYRRQSAHAAAAAVWHNRGRCQQCADMVAQRTATDAALLAAIQQGREIIGIRSANVGADQVCACQQSEGCPHAVGNALRGAGQEQCCLRSHLEA